MVAQIDYRLDVSSRALAAEESRGLEGRSRWLPDWRAAWARAAVFIGMKREGHRPRSWRSRPISAAWRAPSGRCSPSPGGVEHDARRRGGGGGLVRVRSAGRRPRFPLADWSPRRCAARLQRSASRAGAASAEGVEGRPCRRRLNGRARRARRGPPPTRSARRAVPPSRGYCDGAAEDDTPSRSCPVGGPPPREFSRQAHRRDTCEIKTVLDPVRNKRQNEARRRKQYGIFRGLSDPDPKMDVAGVKCAARAGSISSGTCTRRRLATWVAFAPRRSRRCVSASALRRRVPRRRGVPRSRRRPDARREKRP